MVSFYASYGSSTLVLCRREDHQCKTSICEATEAPQHDVNLSRRYLVCEGGDVSLCNVVRLVGTLTRDWVT